LSSGKNNTSYIFNFTRMPCVKDM